MKLQDVLIDLDAPKPLPWGECLFAIGATSLFLWMLLDRMLGAAFLVAKMALH